MPKYLDGTGLTHFWRKVKTLVSQAVGELAGTLSYKPNDTVTISEFRAAVYFGGSQKSFYFTVPLSKDISPEVTEVAVAGDLIVLIDGATVVFKTSDDMTFPSASMTAEAGVARGMGINIHLQLAAKNTDITNNSTGIVKIENLAITFS